MEWHRKTETRGVRETERPVSFIPKGALTHHLQSRRWYPSRWLGSCALHELSCSHFSRGGQAMPQADIPCAGGFMFCPISKTMRWHIATPSRRLPTKTLHRTILRICPGSFIAVIGMSCFPTHLFSLLEKRNRKMKGR